METPVPLESGRTYALRCTNPIGTAHRHALADDLAGDTGIKFVVLPHGIELETSKLDHGGWPPECRPCLFVGGPYHGWAPADITGEEVTFRRDDGDAVYKLVAGGDDKDATFTVYAYQD